MLRIELSKQAAAFLSGIPAKQAKQIAGRIKALAEAPDAIPSELLKAYAPMRRLKTGEYRIIFVIGEGVLQVRLVGKRNDDDIYKQLKRGLGV